MVALFITLAIDLGDFSLNSVTSLSDILWFVGGLVVLLGLTAWVIYHHRRTQPDPFVVSSGREARGLGRDRPILP